MRSHRKLKICGKSDYNASTCYVYGRNSGMNARKSQDYETAIYFQYLLSLSARGAFVVPIKYLVGASPVLHCL